MGHNNKEDTKEEGGCVERKKGLTEKREWIKEESGVEMTKSSVCTFMKLSESKGNYVS